jgi:hypothetical protein
VGLVGIYLELTARCTGCGAGVPFNAYVTRTPCPICNAAVDVDPDNWKSLLGNAVAVDAPLGKTSSVATLSDDLKLDSGREDPRCAGCGTAFPDEVAAFTERGFAMCAGCGRRTSVRTPPPELASLVRGAQLVIGEDLAQLAGGMAQDAPRAREPVLLSCTNCHAPLQFDGSQRSVRCSYCSADLYLPDELWLKLHPVAKVARFYLTWLSAAAVATAQRETFAWHNLADAQIGTDGNLYCTSGGKTTVWCMTPDLTTRWMTNDADAAPHISDPMLALDPTGRVLTWNGQQHSLQVFSSQDGASLGRLGGKQPGDATTRVLDVVALHELAVDRDGTLIALIGEHLCRFARDGSPLELWPPKSGLLGTKHEKLVALYDASGSVLATEGVDVDKLSSQPHALDDYSRVAVGWDGMYYFVRDEWVAKLDRAGKLVYRINVGNDVPGKVGADGAGRAYVVTRKSRQRWLLRISPDGKHVDTLATDHIHGGVLHHENDLICVGSDGTTYHLRFGMILRVLAPDGRLVFISEKAKVADAREREARAKQDV